MLSYDLFVQRFFALLLYSILCLKYLFYSIIGKKPQFLKLRLFIVEKDSPSKKRACGAKYKKALLCKGNYRVAKNLKKGSHVRIHCVAP